MSDQREPGRVIINDEEFHLQLDLLRRTRRFLIEEGVTPPTGTPAIDAQVNASPFSLGRLNLIGYRQPSILPVPFRQAKYAPLADWQLLEEKQDALQRLFTPELQHRFRLQKTQQFITASPLWLLFLSFAALFVAVFAPEVTQEGYVLVSVPAWRFAAFMAWTSCLGGLGAIGFLAMNSLAIQDDATFDISNRSLVGMRIALGALFGCIVSLPFCFSYFKEFADWVIKGGDLAGGGRGVLLLVPFLLGFSTTLVMAVLNRMIGGVEAIFGIEPKVPRRTPAIADSPTTPTARADQTPPANSGVVTRLKAD
jgi:hypothetical protein